MDESDPKISILIIVGDDNFIKQLSNIDLSKLQILFLIGVTISNSLLSKKLMDVKKLDYLHIEDCKPNKGQDLCFPWVEFIQTCYIRPNTLMSYQHIAVPSGVNFTVFISRENFNNVSIPFSLLNVSVKGTSLVSL